MSNGLVEQVERGFYLENIHALKDSCLEQFEENPALYGTLFAVCDAVEMRWPNDQGVPADDVDAWNAALVPPIRDLVLADRGTDDFLRALDGLWEAYRRTLLSP